MKNINQIGLQSSLGIADLYYSRASSVKKRFLTALFQFLAKFWFTPKSLRQTLLKKLLNFKNNSDFTFKVAESEREVLTALNLLKRSETERSQFDYLSKWKINKFLTLPSSTIVTASYRGEIVAVGGLLIDNPFGLPCEISSEVSRLREQGLRIGEILGFTSQKNPHISAEAICLALNQYVALLAREQLKIDYLIAPIPRYLEDLYQGVLCYTKNAFEDDKIPYSDDNTPLNPHFLDLRSNLLSHLTTEQKADFDILQKGYIFPHSDFYVGSFSSKSTQIVQKLYTDKSVLFENLTINDKLTLEKMYSQKSFRNLIPLQSQSLASRRIHMRFPSACPTVIHDNQENLDALAIDVSFKGLSLITKNPLIKKYKMAQSIKLTVTLAPGRSVTLEGEVIWKSSSKSAVGICFNKNLPQEWLSFIDYLESEFVAGQYKKVG
jgi:hypothetical protein